MSSEQRGRPARGAVSAVLSVIGELLITVGLLLGLFVAYELWWTNVQADRQASHEGSALRQAWKAPAAAKPGALDTRGGIGFLHIPRFGKDWSVLIKRGTSTDVLNQGVAGYYTQPYPSAMPWDKKGNVTMAAHRDGHGAKFHQMAELRKGDKLVVETRDDWYVYTVANTKSPFSQYETGVIKPVPQWSGFTEPGRYITLTTCTPMYTSRYRMAVWGELTRIVPVNAQRTPPAELRQ
ncbi:class E sortase [Mangrovactinospora gilvigrisea]|uniref:Class E sortase n=1 Tax=Mangrovactinospora gilvigrisea TaxID=1428644 RepID=A0A1J7BFA2_9ACTN|nr:class E sortase [Mangrovactinospora gilvigrisea]OIV37253.1 class E sortase [Mangrovactinospora gilvigrisea]